VNQVEDEDSAKWACPGRMPTAECRALCGTRPDACGRLAYFIELLTSDGRTMKDADRSEIEGLYWRACRAGFVRSCLDLAKYQMGPMYDRESATPYALVALTCTKGHYVEACKKAKYSLGVRVGVDQRAGLDSLVHDVDRYICTDLDDLFACKDAKLYAEACALGDKESCDPDFLACARDHQYEDCDVDGVINREPRESVASSSDSSSPSPSGSTSSSSSSSPRPPASTASYPLDRTECKNLFIEMGHNGRAFAVRQAPREGGDHDGAQRMGEGTWATESRETEMPLCLQIRCGVQWKECLIYKTASSQEGDTCRSSMDDC